MGKSIGINGKRLQELRVEQALSLRALGERSGVAYDTINKLELGRRPAHASTIRKLADALDVEPKELIKRGIGKAAKKGRESKADGEEEERTR
jgi:transcriptional regulator with XRE-family HTH domain